MDAQIEKLPQVLCPWQNQRSQHSPSPPQALRLSLPSLCPEFTQDMKVRITLKKQTSYILDPGVHNYVT